MTIGWKARNAWQTCTSNKHPTSKRQGHTNLLASSCICARSIAAVQCMCNTSTCTMYDLTPPWQASPTSKQYCIHRLVHVHACKQPCWITAVRNSESQTSVRKRVRSQYDMVLFAHIFCCKSTSIRVLVCNDDDVHISILKCLKLWLFP